MKFEQVFVPLDSILFYQCDSQPCEMLIVYPYQLARDKDGTTHLHTSYQIDNNNDSYYLFAMHNNF